MKQSDIDRCLIMVYESSNHAICANYSIQCQQVTMFCAIPERKADLAEMLRSLAEKIEEEY